MFTFWRFLFVTEQLQAIFSGRLRLWSPGTHPEVQAAQWEAAATPEKPRQPQQLLQQHPAAVFSPRPQQRSVYTTLETKHVKYEV